MRLEQDYNSSAGMLATSGCCTVPAVLLRVVATHCSSTTAAHFVERVVVAAATAVAAGQLYVRRHRVNSYVCTYVLCILSSSVGLKLPAASATGRHSALGKSVWAHSVIAIDQQSGSCVPDWNQHCCLRPVKPFRHSTVQCSSQGVSDDQM